MKNGFLTFIALILLASPMARADFAGETDANIDEFSIQPFSARVEKIVSEKEGQLGSGGRPSKAKFVTIKLDVGIPNDIGYVKFDDNRSEYDIVGSDRLKAGALSDLVVIAVSKKELEAFKKQPLARTAKFHLAHYCHHTSD